ncbi:MAG: hypothetical protein ACI80V_001628 [Rhodothermales bacterium]|jgi:hypothetical protein
MKRVLFLFVVLCLLPGCARETEGTSAASEPEAQQTDMIEIPEHGADEAIAAGVDPMTGLPLALIEAIDQALPGWRVIDSKEWPSSDYITEHNQGKDPEWQAVYENDVFVQADFNGDGRDDFAVFAVGPDGEVTVYALHATDGGFETVELEEQGQVEGCCVGAGLRVAMPGAYSIVDDAGIERFWDLPASGISSFTKNRRCCTCSRTRATTSGPPTRTDRSRSRQGEYGPNCADSRDSWRRQEIPNQPPGLIWCFDMGEVANAGENVTLTAGEGHPRGFNGSGWEDGGVAVNQKGRRLKNSPRQIPLSQVLASPPSHFLESVEGA